MWHLYVCTKIIYFSFFHFLDSIPIFHLSNHQLINLVKSFKNYYKHIKLSCKNKAINTINNEMFEDAFKENLIMECLNLHHLLHIFRRTC